MFFEPEKYFYTISPLTYVGLNIKMYLYLVIHAELKGRERQPFVGMVHVVSVESEEELARIMEG